MKILAIDLGDTSGYVLIRRQPTHLGDRGDLQTVYTNILIDHGTFGLDGIVIDWREEDSELDVVAIERPAYTSAPQQKRYSDLIVELIRRHKEHAVVVRPTDWKQRFGKHPLPGRGVLPTQHEKDAWRIACWAADKYGGQK